MPSIKLILTIAVVSVATNMAVAHLAARKG